MTTRAFDVPACARVCIAMLMLAVTRAMGAENEADWVPLFDGKSLQGWRQLNGTAPYTVVDGAIVGTTRAGTPNSFLATTRSYGDFVLEFEVRQEGIANSGVQIRSASRESEDAGRVHGYQVEVDPSARGWSGGIYEEARRGWLYPLALNPLAQQLYRPGEWNHFRIEAMGSSLRTWINGSPVADLVDDVTKQGFIALQVHSVASEQEAGRHIAWRNLRILETSNASAASGPLFVRNTRANDLSDIEKTQGWRLLWDGRTTTGWQVTQGTAFPASDWKIENGELIVARGAAGADIVTSESFAAFELQLEFKLTPGANSGIKYFVTAQQPGLEYQLLDDERHPDAKMGLNGNRTLASLYDLIPRAALLTGAGVAPKTGEWQHARIVAHLDNRVEHWLNGIKVLEYVRGSPAWRERVASSKFKDLAGFGATARGHILLQDHGDEVRFRSIKVRGL